MKPPVRLRKGSRVVLAKNPAVIMTVVGRLRNEWYGRLRISNIWNGKTKLGPRLPYDRDSFACQHRDGLVAYYERRELLRFDD